MKEGRHVRTRLVRSLDSFIFYALLCVIAITAIPFGTVQPWWIALFESAIFALAVLSVVEIMLGGFKSASAYKLLLPFLALLLFAFLQTLPLKSAVSNATGI